MTMKRQTTAYREGGVAAKKEEQWIVMAMGMVMRSRNVQPRQPESGEQGDFSAFLLALNSFFSASYSSPL